MDKKKKNGLFGIIDPATTIYPFAAIFVLCLYFILDPAGSTNMLSVIRGWLGDQAGTYYLAVGLGVLIVSLWVSFSPLGQITLGKPGEKPKYSFFTWGSMVFTCGLAADILFYSFCEWISYAQEPHIAEMGSIQDWASTYPLFHWGFIPWSFYAMLAACFGFMLHVRSRTKQKYSEACRPLLGEKTDKWQGKLIDIIAVIALIAGTATTFSVATPLLSMALTTLLGIPDSRFLTIAILLIICLTYTVAVLKGIKGVSWLANACMGLFGALLAYVLICGGQPVYIIETGFSAMGNMIQNFIGLATWTDALRTTNFPQNWTMFFWAYWMVWAVASPFFMGSISRGRTVKQVILGTYIFGVMSTLISFIILGNYGLGLQMHGTFDVLAYFAETGGDLYRTVIAIIQTLPLWQLVLVILVVSMIAFYATSFDSITLVASQYSYKEMKEGQEAGTKMKLFWAILLIMLPIALIFSEGSMNNLQTVSIIAAFPIGIVIILIISSFIKDAKDYLEMLQNHETKGKL
ncbi:MAG: BCCT family transporter [Solobacterium sp.]|nr:BCCT family transporter [Solobacterium sp.]